jgi:hypothetical protein
MTFDYMNLSQTQPMTSPSVIYTSDGSPIVATHIVSVLIEKLSVPNVLTEKLSVPKMFMNLLYVG